MRCLIEIAFRKYPTEVLQRLAKAFCSRGGKEFRY